MDVSFASSVVLLIFPIFFQKKKTLAQYSANSLIHRHNICHTPHTKLR